MYDSLLTKRYMRYVLLCFFLLYKPPLFVFLHYAFADHMTETSASKRPQPNGQIETPAAIENCRISAVAVSGISKKDSE